MNETCRQCGSTRVIPKVPLLDHYGDMGGFSKEAQVKVAGAPEAWFFKEEAFGTVYARICGDCGYTELHTSNSRELYEAYQKATGTDD